MLPLGAAGDGEQPLPAAAGSGAGATAEHLLEALTVTSAAAPMSALREAAAAVGSASGAGGGDGGSCGSTADRGGSSSAAPVDADAGRGGVKPAVLGGTDRLPKRLSALPQRGLPVAVMQQMEGISSRWSGDVLGLVELPAGEAKQQQLLQELLGVFEVLQEEVPVPVGCGSPMCTSLGGDLELAYKKICMGCNVVHYCSRECQVAHWKSHKGLCRRMQKEQKDIEGQKEQTGMKKG